MNREDEEPTMYLRLVLLLIEVATDILCRVFKHYATEANKDTHQTNEDACRTSEDACQANEEVKVFLSSHETRIKLNNLNRKKILNDLQFYMVTAESPRIEKFDISLLITLLCNLFDETIEPPEKGWKNNKPAMQDLTLGADLIRLRKYRNKIVGHSACARISDHFFRQYWKDLKSIFIRICRKICPSEEANIVEKIRTYKRKNLDHQTEERCQEAIKDLREKCEDIVKLQEQVEKLIATTEEFKKFFEKTPERFSRYIRLLFEGGQLVLSTILRRECSKHEQDINVLIEQNMEAIREELGAGDDLQSLQITNPEKWDILHISTFIMLLFKDTLKSKETRYIRALLDARKEYAKIALESLDEESFSNRYVDLVQSLSYLSHDLGEMIEDECEKCIAANRVGYERSDNDTDEEYFEHLKEHGVRIRKLSDVYKDTIGELKEALKKVEDEDIGFIIPPVFELKIITLGTNEQKRKLAKQTVETVWRAALKGTENSGRFDEFRQAVEKILEEIRKLDIRADDIRTKCIVLSVICPSPRSVLELLEYIESTHFQEQCFLMSYELCDIYEDTVAVSASLTIESLYAVLKNPRGERDDAYTSEDLTFPLAFGSVKGIHQILDFVEAESTKTSLSTIAEILSEKVDDNITLKLEVDLKCLSEIFSRPEDSCSREDASVKPLPIDTRQISSEDLMKKKDKGSSVETAPVKPFTCEAEVLLEEKNEGQSAVGHSVLHRELSRNVSVDAKPATSDVTENISSLSETENDSTTFEGHHHSTNASMPDKKTRAKKSLLLDGLIICHDDDRNSAEELSKCLNTISILEQRPVETDVFVATFGKPEFLSLEEQVAASTYVFIYFTKSFCENQAEILKAYECLANMFENVEKIYALIPVHTEKRPRSYNVPVGFKSIAYVYFDGRILPEKEKSKLKRMFEIVEETKGNLYNIKPISERHNTEEALHKKEEKMAKPDSKTEFPEKKRSFKFTCLKPTNRSLLVDQEGQETEVWITRCISTIAEGVCKIYGPVLTGTGFRVGSCYVLTAAHVVAAGSIANYYAIFDYLQEFGRTDDDKFFFSEVVYTNTKLDAAILELRPHDKKPIPNGFQYFCEPETIDFFFIGHSKGGVMKTNFVTKLIEIPGKDNANKNHLLHLQQKCKALNKHYDDTEDLKSVLDNSRMLFHCSFTHGGSGSPGIRLIGRDVAVMNMLLCGYPRWYYDKDRPEWDPEDCVEQALSMRALYLDLKVSKPDLCRDIFFQAKFMKVEFDNYSIFTTFRNLFMNRH